MGLSPVADIIVNSLSLLNLITVKTVAANAATGNTLMSTLGIVSAINSTTVATGCPSLAKLSKSSIDAFTQTTKERTVVKNKNEMKHCFSTYLSNVSISSRLANLIGLGD